MNIAWYTRDGDLDFFALISKSYAKLDNKSNSFYVCHTKNEENKLKSEHKVYASNLGDYIDGKKKVNTSWDNKLEAINQKYNKIATRRLVWGEMFEMNKTDDELVFLLVNHFAFWEDFLLNNKIDMILTEGPSILSTSVLWVICEKYNIKFIEYSPVGISGRKNFRTSWEDGIHNFEKYLNSTSFDITVSDVALAEDYYNKMIVKPERPKYVGIELSTGKKIKEGSSYWRFPGLPGYKKIIKYFFKRNKKTNLDNYYLKASKSDRYANWLRTAIRTKRIQYSSIFEKTGNLNDQIFYLLPLHIMGEWSDYAWMGLKYPNIIEFISNCAASLPLGAKLYVKEHPALFPGKTIQFYKSVRRISNVKLVNPYEDTFNLIKKSQGIITLGGTTGWEAYLIGKPVFLLADAWYRQIEGVVKINSFEELSLYLQNVNSFILPSKESKINVLSTLYSISFEASHYPQTEMNSKSNIDKSSQALYNFCSTFNTTKKQ